MSHSALSWAPPPAWQADNSKPRVNAQPTRQALEQRRGLIFEGTPAASHHLGAYPRPHPATYRPCRASSSGGHPLSFFSSSRSEEHTSELQSRGHLVCRLLLEKKKNMT